MGRSGQKYLNGQPFPPPGHLLDPGIEPTSSALAGGVFTTEPPVVNNSSYSMLSVQITGISNYWYFLLLNDPEP